MKIIITAKAKRKGKKWDPNPWRVCYTSMGSDAKKEEPEKFERCVKKVKKKQD